MEWDLETRRKLAKEIRRVSLEIQKEEFAKNNGRHFAEGVENTIKRIMDKLTPLGFEPATRTGSTKKSTTEKFSWKTSTRTPRPICGSKQPSAG